MQGNNTSAFSKPVWIYRVLFRLLSPLVLAYTLWRTYKDGGTRYLRERLGLYGSSSKLAVQDCQATANIWIHAASVGEVFTVLPLLKSLKATGKPILVTTMTPTGADVLAQQNLSHVQHRYLPVDFAGACKRFFQHANVCQGWVVETEIWPWLYARAHACGIPLTIINARLSDKTSAQSSGVMASAFRRALHGVRILARSEDDARRFAELGAAKALITVVGNLKYADADADAKRERSGNRKKLPRLIARPYVLAASTHENEEEQLAVAWCRQTNHPKSTTLLVLVPRHPERGAAVQKQLASLGITAALRSQNEAPETDTLVYIADTLGELQAWYVHAIAGFVGGSLIERGGHNMLEAARAGCPIITGPHTFNFTDIVQTLMADDAMHVAEDASEVVAFFYRVLHDPESFEAMTQRARHQAKNSQGVLQRYLEILNADAKVPNE